MKREKGKAVYETKELFEINSCGIVTVCIGICVCADCFLCSDSRRNSGAKQFQSIQKKSGYISWLELDSCK